MCCQKHNFDRLALTLLGGQKARQIPKIISWDGKGGQVYLSAVYQDRGLSSLHSAQVLLATDRSGGCQWRFSRRQLARRLLQGSLHRAGIADSGVRASDGAGCNLPQRCPLPAITFCGQWAF
jgi:hypothetical protein